MAGMAETTAPGTARLFTGGAWCDGATTYPLTDEFSGEWLADVHVPSREHVDAAVHSVSGAQQACSQSARRRAEILLRAAELMSERRDAFIETIISDTGFTTGDAEKETARAIETLRLCGEEAGRSTGRTVPLDGGPGGAGRLAFTIRKPLGVVCAITPFNAPLNTVCHKVGPALAAGNGVVLKPAPETPLTAVRLVEVLLEAGVPEGLIALVHGGADVGQWLLENEVPAFYAFTGSTRVGEHIARTVGLRRTQLELGSIASTVVCADADLDRAAGLCVNAAFRKAGQVCTSVQRLYVERAVAHETAELLTAKLAGRPVGDPRAPGAFVGPLISSESADRVEAWVREAVDGGATIATGGTRTGSVLAPTVLTGVTPEMRVMSQEIFGPVVVLRPFDDFDDAIAEANATPYGLAAGVFTANLDRALDAAQRLRVGTLHINETSSSRVDLMPFGGVKASGSGTEGPRYAIEEMTEETLVTIGTSAG